MLAVLGLAAIVLLGGLGYIKYQGLQRMRIEEAVLEGLQSAPSPVLRAAHFSVLVNDAHEVTIGGSVPTSDDANAAIALVTAIPGVTRVTNRLQIVPPILPRGGGTPQIESSDSLVDRGMGLMDDGKYPEAIECFTKAANDPNNKSAKELLETARRAQKTEEDLMKKRQ